MLPTSLGWKQEGNGKAREAERGSERLWLSETSPEPTARVRGCLWETVSVGAGGTERAWGAKRRVSGCALDPFLRFCLELDGLRVSSRAATRCDLKIQ